MIVTLRCMVRQEKALRNHIRFTTLKWTTNTTQIGQSRCVQNAGLCSKWLLLRPLFVTLCIIAARVWPYLTGWSEKSREQCRTLRPKSLRARKLDSFSLDSTKIRSLTNSLKKNWQSNRATQFFGTILKWKTIWVCLSICRRKASRWPLNRRWTVI